ncbi:MAG TPA: molybdopterin cofactor-binding domain-containing protein [Vicinamibacterales bacterium]|jgi:isoquinoline 1-oxidoreductase beta subunit|nr:molybdopterin cofactor-binding domain-containing protein [Vicinamibacterales bacterium]
MTATRRDFLKAGAAVGGLALLFELPRVFTRERAAVFDPNAYLRIDQDGAVTLWVTHLEMGQGVRTVLPMILAEELDADWTRVRIEQASPGPRFSGIRLHTSGSDSSSDSYETLRHAAATAREMLISAAAARWHVPAAECRADQGAIVHVPTARRVDFGAVAGDAVHMPVPKDPPLKRVADYRILGRPMKRVDGPRIVTGAAEYGIDVRVPGMLFASIERAPRFGAAVARVDDSAARRVAGVRQVVTVSSGIHAGVAVVADDTWAAVRGRRALSIEWTAGLDPAFDSDVFLASLPGALDRASIKVRREGDADAAMRAAHRHYEATYVFPFEAHATMEPMNCTADVRADRAEIWAPTQTDVRTLAQIVRVTGLPEKAITLHCSMMGGGFGRRLFSDYAAEAAEVSRKAGAPVQVTWTREDDMRHGYFQPASAERFTAAIDGRGRVAALVHRTTHSDLTIYDIHEGRNIWSGRPRPAVASDEFERDEIPWGAFDNPYEWPALRVDGVDATSPVPTGPWRAVMYPSTIFGRESFIDEVAHLTGQDPIEFRLSILPRDVKQVGEYRIDRGRLARVLERARDRARWPAVSAAAPGRRSGRGIAANTYHAGSYLAMIADVSIADDLTDLRVDHITTVIDCGLALNPLGVLGQAESAITWGLSATLLGKIDFKGGAAVQSNYSDYHVMRIDRMPVLDTTIVESTSAPGGFGEHAVPLVAPAVANAVFAATGRRLRELPLRLSA